MRDENAEESADWFPLRIDCPPCGRRQCRDLPDLQHLRASFLTAGFRGFGCCGYQLPAGMRESDKLETALFTPSTKAELGQHDQNISPEEASRLLGEDVARKVRETTLAIYEAGRAYAASRGIIVADTKFEFGFVDGELRLIDEVLTPDSSRFWPADQYEPGRSQPSFDKQYLRDWLTSQPWDMQPPAPALPAEVVDATARRYREAYHILTGKEFTI